VLNLLLRLVLGNFNPEKTRLNICPKVGFSPLSGSKFNIAKPYTMSCVGSTSISEAPLWSGG
jgi:hypothetical protein